MKIIVNNEEEKKILKRFMDYLYEFGFEEMEVLDEKWSKDNEVDQSLWSHEWTLLSDSFYGGCIIVDEKEAEMYFEDDSVISGVCTVCGTHTTGTIDGDSVSYSDFLKSCSPEQVSAWKCETCFYKHSVEEDWVSEPVKLITDISIRELLTHLPDYGNMMNVMNEVVMQVSTQTDDLLHQWVKATLQDKFDDSVIFNTSKVEFTAKIKEAGYTIFHPGFDEYVLVHNEVEVARIKLPIVFNN